jgi:hypothetical protein
MSELKKYKVYFWNNGNKNVEEIEAYSKYNAKARFYLLHPCDDIIRIEEVTEE